MLGWHCHGRSWCDDAAPQLGPLPGHRPHASHLVTAGDRDSAQCTCPLVRSRQPTRHTPRSPVCSRTWTCLFGSAGPAGAWGWDMLSNYLSSSVGCPATPRGPPSSTPPPATGTAASPRPPLQTRAGQGGDSCSSSSRHLPPGRPRLQLQCPLFCLSLDGPPVCPASP